MFSCLHFIALLPSYDAVYKLPVQERLMFDRKTVAHSLKHVYSCVSSERIKDYTKQTKKRIEIDTWHIHKKLQKRTLWPFKSPCCDVSLSGTSKQGGEPLALRRLTFLS